MTKMDDPLYEKSQQAMRQQMRLRILQTQNGLECIKTIAQEHRFSPSNEAAFSFLDFLGVSRNTAVVQANNQLKGQIYRVLSYADDATVAKLLESAFPYITVPDLCDVPFALLERMNANEVPKEILSALVLHDELWPRLSKELRILVWETDPLQCSSVYDSYIQTFVVEVSNSDLYLDYIRDNNTVLIARNQIENVITLLEDSPVLYRDGLLPYLRHEYYRTKNIGYCIARYELGLAMHRRGLTKIDPLSAFIWCWNGALRLNDIDKKTLEKLKMIAENTQPKSNILHHMGMIMSHPLINNLLKKRITNRLDELIDIYSFPGQDDIMYSLMQLYGLADKLQRKGKAKYWPQFDANSQLFHSFLPSLCNYCVCERMNISSQVEWELVEEDDEKSICNSLMFFFIVKEATKNGDVSKDLINTVKQADKPSAFLHSIGKIMTEEQLQELLK